MCDSLSIRNQLSEPADLSPEGVSRRRFLQYTLAGAAIAGTGVSVGLRDAFGVDNAASGDNILVLVELLGGNDGLNTVAPTGSGRYRDLRGGIALGEGEGHGIAGGLELHPELSELKRLWDSDDLAVVQGIGYADSTLSHFDSMALWMGGAHGLTVGRRPETGWIGRHLDALGAERSPVHAVAFDSSIPLHMRGAEAKAVTLRTGELPQFGTETGAPWRRMYDAVRRMADGSSSQGPWADALADAGAQALDVAADLEPAYRSPLSGSAFSEEMVQAARLINVDVGVRVITIQTAGFDNHRQHKWSHGVALGALNKGLEDFYDELDPRVADRVSVMTFSEFGRRPQKNASGGTDHGSASVAFVMGPRVKGGLYGEYPGLNDLDSRGNLKPKLDFRSLYGTVLEGWLGADGNAIVNGSFEGLSIFGSAPDGRASTPVVPVPAPGRATPDAVNKPAPAPVARHGYLVLTDSGEVYNHGKHATFGVVDDANPVAIRRSGEVDGYWVATGRGRVRAFGGADHHGDVEHIDLNAPIVAMASTSSGAGYWLASDDGGIFALGDARFHGSAGAIPLAAPITGIAAHPSGRGYWLCAADGGVFAYDAPFHGSAGSLALAAPVVSIAAHPGGRGYWLLSADGGVFAYGAAGFHGSVGGLQLAAPVVDIAATRTGRGYWLLGQDGGVFTFGDATFQGAPAQARIVGRAVSITS